MCGTFCLLAEPGAPKMLGRITGSVTAMDPNTGKVVAKYEMPFPNLAGVLATKGGLGLCEKGSLGYQLHQQVD